MMMNPHSYLKSTVIHKNMSPVTSFDCYAVDYYFPQHSGGINKEGKWGIA
jgi:hypothetical protein